MKGRKYKRVILFVGLLAVLLFVVIPYGKVEYLTMKHGDEFAGLYTLTGMIDRVEYCKIMAYSEREAKVYYVAEHKSAGILSTFSREETKWKCEAWDVVWSATGSADHFIWPYYR